MQHASTLRRDILKFLASVAEAVDESAAGALLMRRQAIEAMFEPRYPRRQIRQMVSRLQYRRLIRLEHDVVHLMPEGLARARVYRLEELSLDRVAPWDGRWRVVIWDIPEKERKQRDTIRLFLRKLGFIRIQRSIWVVPYECKSQLTYLRDALGIKSGLLYMEATVIEGAAALRRHFHLIEPA